MVLLNIFQSLQGFLKLLIASALAYFAPTKTVLIATFCFVLCDFITGIMASKKLGIEIQSVKMKPKVISMIAYFIAILLSHAFDNLVMDEYGLPHSFPMITAYILIMEFISNLENLSKITGIPFTIGTKENLFKYLKDKVAGNKMQQDDSNRSNK